MKASDIFAKLVTKAYGLSWRPFGRPSGFAVGIPGELVQSLSYEERSALKDFKADDISADKILHGQLLLFAEALKSESFINQEKLKFDRKILKR